MPFRYGIATMTDVPQAYVRLAVEIEGVEVNGISSDLLPPKWFTKDPDKAVPAEIDEMLETIKTALQVSGGMSGRSAFDLWQQIYSAQAAWAKSHSVPPLLAHFGTSLVERALIDACCRSAGRPFWQMLRDNAFGIQLEQIHPELANRSPAMFLPERPLESVIARHTIGLSDPLTEEEISPADRLDDGLPQSLAANIQSYGLRHFKIKLSGSLDHDSERLVKIAEILKTASAPDLAFSLDGNEQFEASDQFRHYWENLSADRRLTDFLRRLLFVEQPIHRANALSKEVGQIFADWTRKPPTIIDESDGAIEDLQTALALGYSGTSHKNCKGVFKGIAHRCLIAQFTRAGASRVLLMSGEDLCNVGPVSLHQDLAVMAALGVHSVERNGHHYHAGLSQFPAALRDSALKHHPDLYSAPPGRWPAIRISRGEMSASTINRAAFGLDFNVDLAAFPKIV